MLVAAMNRRDFLLRTPALSAAAAAAAPSSVIHRVDLVHHTHTDVGYTDLPSVCRDMQKRFIDAGLDLCLSDKRFRWTIESMLGLDDWWRATADSRHAELLRMIRAGQMDVMGLPFNQAAFQNAMQWDQALHWIPDDVWKQVNPRAAMQNDVNGIPRAGAMRLLDRGVNHLLMGINPDSGGPPFRRPSAFWWKMPDGRRMFVWLGYHYGNAFSFFEAKSWIRQQPKWAATEYRPPTSADVLQIDETHLRAAKKRFDEQAAKLVGEGYDYPTLILSYTNQWRYDNDPPFPPLGAFVEAWNKAKLEPELRLVTATDAVFAMEKEVGARVPVHEGEWTDWWANGDASGPREVAASRAAKRFLAAAVSPVWGPMPAAAKPAIESMLKDLCLFDEHTWGANESVWRPYSLFTLGQYTEKSLLAYKPMGHAEALLGLRARTKLDGAGEGLHIVNTSALPFTGWANFMAESIHEEVNSLEGDGGLKLQLYRQSGRPARVWVNRLAPNATLRLRPAAAKVDDRPEQLTPEIQKDERGWPVAATWRGMPAPLFKGELAHFIAAEFAPPADRQTISRLHGTADAAKRKQMRDEMLRFNPARYGSVEPSETAHTLIFTQPIEHGRIANGQRTIELWKEQPRARVAVRFDRISSLRPEVLYLAFGFPAEGVMPALSNGGAPFTPYKDQLIGSCRDYYAIDGWAHYATSQGHWLWVTRDAPLVTVGGPHTLARRTDAPADTHRMTAMVFDNCWHTNFVADSNGTMEFQFELAFATSLDKPDEMANALVSEPVIVANGTGRNAEGLERSLFRV
jgi:hypothetical protein